MSGEVQGNTAAAPPALQQGLQQTPTTAAPSTVVATNNQPTPKELESATDNTIIDLINGIPEEKLSELSKEEAMKLFVGLKNQVLADADLKKQYSSIMEESKRARDAELRREQEEREKLRTQYKSKLDALHNAYLTDPTTGSKTENADKIKKADLVISGFNDRIAGTTSLADLNKEYMLLEQVYAHGAELTEMAMKSRENEARLQEQLKQNTVNINSAVGAKIDQLYKYTSLTSGVRNRDMFAAPESRFVNPPPVNGRAESTLSSTTTTTTTTAASSNTTQSPPPQHSRALGLLDNLRAGKGYGPEIASRAIFGDNIRMNPYGRP
jgi:predicted acyl esterase